MAALLLPRPALAALGGLLLGCSSSSSTLPPDASADHDGGSHGADTGTEGGRDAASDGTRVDATSDAPAASEAATPDARADSQAACTPGAMGCPASAITHVVLVVQENHTFDNYFGTYCTAPTGSAPTCTTGPACCEAGPATDPSGASPTALNDATNASWDPIHEQACEIGEMDDRKMDMYVTGTVCSGAGNFAYADGTVVPTYWNLAASGAIADRYFQSAAGASGENDMYFAAAKFVFLDNDYEAKAKGAACAEAAPEAAYTTPSLEDLLIGAGVTVSSYAGGYAVAAASDPNCAAPPAACPNHVAGYPCDYDPGDIPFQYYASTADNPLYMKDFTQFPTDLQQGTLPAFSYVKGIGYQSEHPGVIDGISTGQGFVQRVVDLVTSSSYASSTLILVTWDESGGYFDHVPPPPTSTVDNELYGPRIPLIALGPFVKPNGISHVPMEHSSIVKFVEWNWLGEQTGQLEGRDAVVNNLGSLLDPTKTGVAVPE